VQIRNLACVCFTQSVAKRWLGVALAAALVATTAASAVVTLVEDGRILYEGFGQAAVRSPDQRSRFEAAGARIQLHARGLGRAFLAGPS